MSIKRTMAETRTNTSSGCQFVKCRLELSLMPCSPMIHFQGRQKGATLRATEVKPKLDRFILKKLMQKEGICDVEKLKRMEQYRNHLYPLKDKEA